MGRGGLSNNHVGNQTFLKLTKALKPEYARLPKEEKTDVSRRLLKMVHGRGGKFLAKDAESGLFYEVEDKIARRKCSQALRDATVDEPTPKQLAERNKKRRERYAAARKAGAAGQPVPAGKRGRKPRQDHMDKPKAKRAKKSAAVPSLAESIRAGQNPDEATAAASEAAEASIAAAVGDPTAESLAVEAAAAAAVEAAAAIGDGDVVVEEHAV